MKKELLEPAFPLASEELSDRYDAGISLHTGITIRDYFAAKAMQGMLANGISIDINGNYPAEQRAQTAYMIADAMLKARNE